VLLPVKYLLASWT